MHIDGSQIYKGGETSSNVDRTRDVILEYTMLRHIHAAQVIVANLLNSSVVLLTTHSNRSEKEDIGASTRRPMKSLWDQILKAHSQSNKAWLIVSLSKIADLASFLRSNMTIVWPFFHGKTPFASSPYKMAKLMWSQRPLTDFHNLLAAGPYCKLQVRKCSKIPSQYSDFTEKIRLALGHQCYYL